MPVNETKTEAVKAVKTAKTTKTAKTAEKKQPVKRAAAKKTAAAKKAAAKPVEVKKSVFVQFMGSEYEVSAIEANVKKAWMEQTGKAESEIKDMKLYIKPEEGVAYYVINDEFSEEGNKVEL